MYLMKYVLLIAEYVVLLEVGADTQADLLLMNDTRCLKIVAVRINIIHIRKHVPCLLTK